MDKCPKCCALCEIVGENFGTDEKPVLLARYKPLPQPDLTGLREAYSKSGNYSLYLSDKDIRERYENLMQAVKELFEKI